MYYCALLLQSRYPLGLWPWQVDQEPSPLIGDDELRSLSWSQSKRYRFSKVSFPGQPQVNTGLARRRVGRGGRLVSSTLLPHTHPYVHVHTYLTHNQICIHNCGMDLELCYSPSIARVLFLSHTCYLQNTRGILLMCI